MMRKQSLLTALATAAAIAACPQASAGSWSFTYQGFLDTGTGRFDPNTKLSGNFSGEDRNGDGIIEAAELSELGIDGIDYLSSSEVYAGCIPEPIRITCTLDRFSYALTGQLNFSASYSYGHSDGVFEYGKYVTGVNFEKGGHFVPPGWSTRWAWTDQTQFTITPPPVPEPATAALWLTGSALVGAALRRRRAGNAQRQ